MQPTGPQIERLQDALLSAYPSESTLRQMVRIHLDASLDAVVPLHRQNQSDIVFDLIECYAAKPGGLHVLIQAAVAGNPGNRSLAAVAADLLAIDFDPLPLPPDRRQILWVNVPPKPAAPLLGRDDLIDDLISRLTAGHSPALSTDGLPGVGKTALAVALAHDERVRLALPDGVLWGGLGVTPDVETVQNLWAAALGLDLADEPDVHRRTARLSEVLGERRVLVLLDDAWDVETAKALRLSSPKAVHLLTTRDRRIARDFAGATQQVHVPELEPALAYELLERLAPEACAADPEAARQLVATVGELPLAIEVLGGYLTGHDLTVFPDLAPDAFAEMSNAQQRLALACERLGGQPGKQETLEAAVRLSVEALPPEAAAVFWTLGAFAPKPATFDREAAQSVTQAEPSALALLVGRNLVEAADGVLAVHQVVHDVMAGAVPAEAVERHRGFYLDLVDEDREDWQRIEAVYEQVRYAWQQLTGSREWSTQMLQFVLRLMTYQERRGRLVERLEWCKTALVFAETESLDTERASILLNIGSVYMILGDRRQALNHFQLALPIFRQLGDLFGEATTLTDIGSAYFGMGDKHRALDYFEQAIPLHESTGDFSGQATTLNNIGGIYSRNGDFDRALAYYHQALSMNKLVGNQREIAATLVNIGRVHDNLGDRSSSLDFYQQALALFRETGDMVGEAISLNNMGSIFDIQGDKRSALDCFRQSCSLKSQIGDKAGEAKTLSNIGSVYISLGDIIAAKDHFHQALLIQHEIGDRRGEAITLNNIGLACDNAGDRDQALIHYGHAAQLFAQLGDQRDLALVLDNMGSLYSAKGEMLNALKCFQEILKLDREARLKKKEPFTLLKIVDVLVQLADDRSAIAYLQEFLSACNELDEKELVSLGLREIAVRTRSVLAPDA